MQPVRKRKQVDRRWLILAGALAALLILATALLLWRRPAPLLIDRHEEERVPLITREAQDLLRVEVTNSQGGRFSLARKEDGLVVEGQPDFIVDTLQGELIVQDLTLLYANEIAGEMVPGATSVPELGLDDSAPRAQAFYADGSSLTLVFGHDAHTEIPSSYLMVLGDRLVYLVSPETRDHFDRALETLHQVPAINFNPSLLDTLQVKGRAPFTLSQLEGLWELSAPYTYPADSTAVRQLLDSISKMRFALYAGEASEENLQRYGLGVPDRTITFMLSDSLLTGFDRQGAQTTSRAIPAQQLRIALGEGIGNIGLYCLYEGKIYQASNASMGFLRDSTLERLRSPTPVNIPIARLHALEVLDGTATRVYRVELVEQVLPNNQLALDEQGQVLHVPVITLNGQQTDQDAFMRQYLTLMALGRSGRLPEGFTPQSGTPSRMYRFDTAQGRRELALFHYDALHYAMRVNGVFADYVLRESADSITL